MKRFFIYCVLMIVALMIGGCSLKEIEKPAIKYDIIYRKNFPVQDREICPNILKIAHIKSLDRLHSDKIWYQKSNFQTNSYIYSFWNDDFSSIIEKNLTDAIYDSHIFRAVFQGYSKIRANYVLECELSDALQHIGEKSFVRLTLRVYVLNAKNKKLIGSKEFSYKQKCEKINAKGAVEAYNEIIKKLDKDVVLWLEQLMKRN